MVDLARWEGILLVAVFVAELFDHSTAEDTIGKLAGEALYSWLVDSVYMAPFVALYLILLGVGASRGRRALAVAMSVAFALVALLAVDGLDPDDGITYAIGFAMLAFGLVVYLPGQTPSDRALVTSLLAVGVVFFALCAAVAANG